MTSQRSSARLFATVVLGAPSVAAIYGSAASLIQIAGEEALEAAWVLPFCLDLLAIGVVIAGVLYGHDDRLSRFIPVGAYASSAALQVADVWADGPRAWAVHALPLAAAILGTEKILRMWRPAPVVAPPLVGASDPGKSRVSEEIVAAVGSASSERPIHVELPRPEVRPGRKREPRPATRRRPAARPAEADPAVVEKVRAAVADLGVPLDQVTRDQILKHLRPGAPHATKVGAALKSLKEQS